MQLLRVIYSVGFVLSNTDNAPFLFQLYGVDDNISRSKKIMTSISKRMDRNKWIIGSIVTVLVIAIAVILYFKLFM